MRISNEYYDKRLKCESCAQLNAACLECVGVYESPDGEPKCTRCRSGSYLNGAGQQACRCRGWRAEACAVSGWCVRITVAH